MSMDPLAPVAPPQEPTRRQLAEENAALKSRVADLEAQVAALSADLSAAREAAARPVGEESPVLLARLRYNGVHYEAGALVPFDPENPPPGCGGLVEGVHYHRARVLAPR